MIVPMRKITLVVQSKDIDATLQSLRSAGVVHIEHQNPPAGEDLARLGERYTDLLSAIRALPAARGESLQAKGPEEMVREILDLVSEKELIAEGLKKIKRDIETWREWGDFDPELIDDLRGRCIWVRLCKLANKEVGNTPKGVILEELFRKGNILYCLAISMEETDLPFSVMPLPEKGLAEMLLEQDREAHKIKEIEGRLGKISLCRDTLLSYARRLESLIEFSKVRSGMGSFEGLSYLMGYCPDYNAGLLEKIAEKERWGILIEEPGEGDNVPTLIKNPGWVDMIRPVLETIKTIPGYREVDISFWFLLFFSVFFGMLVGDAGYGWIFLIINTIAHIKLGRSVKDRSIFFLIYVLSISAIIWGVFTGTFFGQAWLPGRIKPLLPYLTESANVQALCFLIGAIHLSIAHAWRFIRKAPSLQALSEAGWIAMLWAAYFVAKSLILGEQFSQHGKWLLVSGASLVILFTSPRRNVLKGIGSGIGDLLLRAVNSFTDVVSYIRLFAVGAASVAVADAFNNIAATLGYHSFISGLMTALILLFGHTLNILLGAMAVLVHGVRLNVLEFSSHLNMEWSGVEYKPFSPKT